MITISILDDLFRYNDFYDMLEKTTFTKILNHSKYSDFIYMVNHTKAYHDWYITEGQIWIKDVKDISIDDLIELYYLHLKCAE